MLYSKRRHFNSTRFGIVIFSNILQLEINFRNLYQKIAVLHKVSEKNLVKININKKSKKKELAYSTACNLKWLVYGA